MGEGGRLMSGTFNFEVKYMWYGRKVMSMAILQAIWQLWGVVLERARITEPSRSSDRVFIPPVN